MRAVALPNSHVRRTGMAEGHLEEIIGSDVEGGAWRGIGLEWEEGFTAA